MIGTHGSGTIFFSGCSLRCVYCQNFDVSHNRRGDDISQGRLAEIMLELQESGCHNINLVSPTHYVPQIAEAVDAAKGHGLCLPIVYNTHGYDTPEALAIMQGKVDIYLTDMKYADNKTARNLSGAGEYRGVNRLAVENMFSQVGHLSEDLATGVAARGLLVRILILPCQMEGAKETLSYLKERFSTDLCISLMAQYAPLHKAGQWPPLNRGLTEEEYDEIVEYAFRLGFDRLWLQEPESALVGIPDFSADEPFAFS